MLSSLFIHVFINSFHCYQIRSNSRKISINTNCIQKFNTLISNFRCILSIGRTIVVNEQYLSNLGWYWIYLILKDNNIHFRSLISLPCLGQKILPYNTYTNTSFKIDRCSRILNRNKITLLKCTTVTSQTTTYVG